MGVVDRLTAWFDADHPTPVYTGHTYTDTITDENLVVDSVGSTFVRIERQDAERRPYSKVATDRFRNLIEDEIVTHNLDACLHCRPDTNTDV